MELLKLSSKSHGILELQDVTSPLDRAGGPSPIASRWLILNDRKCHVEVSSFNFKVWSLWGREGN